MARPQKTGLDYFSMDVDMQQDVKIRKLLKRKGGARALGVFIQLLCKIYKNSYYIDYNEDMVFIISEDLYEEESYVTEIIQYSLELGLLDKDMYEQHGVLTSHGIQERYLMVQAKYRRNSTIDRYNLLEESQETVSSTKNSVNATKTEDNAAETPVNAVKCGNNAGFFDVSSSPFKKKKEKKIEKKSSTTTTTPRARIRRFSGDKPVPRNEGIDEELRQLARSTEWQKNIIDLFGINDEELSMRLKQFGSVCKSRGKEYHQSVEDLKSHFSDWLRIQLEESVNKTNSSENGKSTLQFKSTDQRRPASVPAGKRQADFRKPF